MASGGSKRWVIVVATTWIQAFTGTNLDFSSYSSELKTALGISQVELIFLSIASDMGKAFGWCSALCLSILYFPFWLVLFLAGLVGLVGYGLQWLIIIDVISLPYVLVFILCLLAGCSISWFNTVCYVLCIHNFPTNRALALSLSISFNGISAAIYTLLVNAINSNQDSLYLLLNATVPLITSIISLLPTLCHKLPSIAPSSDDHHQDPIDGTSSFTFVSLYLCATITGLYLIALNSVSLDTAFSCVVFLGAVVLLALPLLLVRVICSNSPRDDHHQSHPWIESIVSRFEGMSFNLVDIHDLQCDNLRKPLVVRDPDDDDDSEHNGTCSQNGINAEGLVGTNCVQTLLCKDRLLSLGKEHSARVLVRRLDFWLYYMAYLCGGTIGLAYSNNLGQIVQSLGYSSKTDFVVTIYSTSSFFGRLASAAPDFLSNKVFFARTGWLALAIFPTPIAFFLLVLSGTWSAICASTALIGFSSGFVFSAAVSVSSELFGPNSAGLNHNILITNIPIGSLSYGLLAAIVYDSHASTTSSFYHQGTLGDCTVCMGRVCFFESFLWFGCISLWGFLCSLLLFFRTKPAYDHLRRNNK